MGHSKAARPWRRARGLLVAAFVALSSVARAEVVEEIVANVNDDIITRSDLEAEEEAVIAELYRNLSGARLDEEVARARSELLRNLIERKLLLHRAQRVFDMEKMADAILKGFREQQQISSERELERLLAQENLTLAEFRKRLLEYYAPRQVVEAEVRDRISVSDAELLAYYEAHGAEFDVPAEAVFREIVLLAGPGERERRRKEAEAIRARAAAPGADFAALARELSEAGTREAGGLLGPVRPGDLLPELEAVVFGLPVGEVGPVIETPNGFHIVRVERRTDSRRKSLDEVREELRQNLLEGKFREALDGYLKKLWSEASVEVAARYRERLVLPWEVPVRILGAEGPSSR